jgi:putative hydrolase of the HAD superfamily
MRSTIDGVVFDWGGTLTPIPEVDPLQVWESAARLLAPDRAAALAGALARAQEEVWSSTVESGRSARVAEIVAAAMTAAGLPAAADEGVAAAVSAYLGEWVPHSAARHDAATVLLALRDRGYRIGLLSNTHWPAQWHDERLVADGLADLLDARVYTSDLDYRKPHPAAFTAVLSRLGIEPQRAVFVGDRLHDDVFGAQATGMRAIWIRNRAWESWDVEPDAVVDELGEVVGVIDRWAS